jgi:hypothetical protein
VAYLESKDVGCLADKGTEVARTIERQAKWNAELPMQQFFDYILTWSARRIHEWQLSTVAKELFIFPMDFWADMTIPYPHQAHGDEWRDI